MGAVFATTNSEKRMERQDHLEIQEEDAVLVGNEDVRIRVPERLSAEDHDITSNSIYPPVPWNYVPDKRYSKPLEESHFLFSVTDAKKESYGEFYLEQKFAWENSEALRRIIDHPISTEKEGDKIVVNVEADPKAFNLFMELLKHPYATFCRHRSQAWKLALSPIFSEALVLAHKYEARQAIFTAEDIMMEIESREVVTIYHLKLAVKYDMDRAVRQWIEILYHHLYMTARGSSIMQPAQDGAQDRLTMDDLSPSVLKMLVELTMTRPGSHRYPSTRMGLRYRD